VSSGPELTYEVLAVGPWPRERVSVVTAPGFRVPAAQEVLIEQDWLLAQEGAARSGQRLFNGPVAGLASFRPGERLELALHATDYRSFVGTNLSARYRALGIPCADALGISIVVELDGRRVLLHRRGKASFEWPLAIDTPGGHIEPDAHREGVAPSPFLAALDELEGELGVRPDEVESLSVLGLARITGTRKPQVVIRARVLVSFATIRANLAAARESFETSELLEPLSVDELGALAASPERMTPAGRAAIAIARRVL
jgi:8-oxo-dGTP pyrophosphatase MutT (NUDIX family)